MWNAEDSFIDCLRLMGGNLASSSSRAAAGNQSTASTTFKVGNFDIGFSLLDDDCEFDTSSDLFI